MNGFKTEVLQKPMKDETKQTQSKDLYFQPSWVDLMVKKEI